MYRSFPEPRNLVSDAVSTEREIKLLAKGKVRNEVILSAGRALGIRIGKPKTVQQSDTYLDDRDFHVARSGAGLRLRRVDKQKILCWKSDGEVIDTVLARTEIEIPWRGSPPRRAADLFAILSQCQRDI